jgi:hypothetical protein
MENFLKVGDVPRRKLRRIDCLEEKPIRVWRDRGNARTRHVCREQHLVTVTPFCCSLKRLGARPMPMIPHRQGPIDSRLLGGAEPLVKGDRSTWQKPSREIAMFRLAVALAFLFMVLPAIMLLPSSVGSARGVTSAKSEKTMKEGRKQPRAGYRAGSQRSCGVFMYWKDGKCNDARNKPAKK